MVRGRSLTVLLVFGHFKLYVLYGNNSFREGALIKKSCISAKQCAQFTIQRSRGRILVLQSKEVGIGVNAKQHKTMEGMVRDF